jgi:hypothetical protein
MVNRISRLLDDQWPLCPICERRSKERRHGLAWCSDCDAGWETPREFTRRKRLKPHEARDQLIGRRPWCADGRPIVLSRKGRQG